MGDDAADHFTPQVMLSAPRRSAGVANPSGTTVLYTITSYSFQDHRQTVLVQALHIETGRTTDISADQDLSDFNWLDDDRFFCLRPENDGTTSVLLGSISAASECDGTAAPLQVAGIIDARATSMKVSRISETCDDYAIVLNAPACRDDSLFTPEIAACKTYSSGKLYDGLFVRHWDRYEGPEKQSLWYGRLDHVDSGQYKLSTLTNLLAGTSLESPIPPHGGTNHFDIRKDAIIWVAKDPDINPSINTKCNVYIQHIVSWNPNEACPNPNPRQIDVKGFEGAAVSPVFAPVGEKAAFLMMRWNKYEADKNRIALVADIKSSTLGTEVLHSTSETWDRSPQSICFAADGKSLIVTDDEEGYGRVFYIPGKSVDADHKPCPLINKGTASKVQSLNDGRVFVSGTSFIDDSWYAIVDPLVHGIDPDPGDTREVIWSNSHSDQGTKLGLQRLKIDSIWTPASNPAINKEIHSWVLKPSFFDSSRSYPVAYIIHGGPHASFRDAWNTRWNAAVFAEQGYIVVAPDPSGSTGYGQEFTDSSIGDWGGSPYEDLVNVYDWVGEHVEGADNERAVALGNSYGGYMINWIQGHDLGRKFKALVCHNGIFSSAGMLATDELHFQFYEMDGPPWDQDFVPATLPRRSKPEEQRKWDPSLHMMQWSTPELVIHSERDYRVTMSEGLAMFNMLQARGVPSQFLTFPDENHWVSKPENSLAWHKTVFNWINKYVGLPPFIDEDPNGAEYWGGTATG